MFRQIAKLIFLLMLVVAGAGGLWWYQYRNSPQREIERLKAEKERLEAARAELEGYIARLTSERRAAELVVVDQPKSPDGKIESTTLILFECRPDGSKLAPRTFTIKGDQVHIDAIVIRFENEFVKLDDRLRGHSLALFYRLFGEHQTPADGFRIDEPGLVPLVYRSAPGRSEEVRAFEEELWTNIWKLAENPALRKSMGVSVVSPESPWSNLKGDFRYTITLAANGGLTMRSEPLDDIWRSFRDAVRQKK